MKLKRLLLATIATGALIGGSFQSNAQLGFTVDPGQPWYGYINAFELDGTTYATGFPDATADLRASFSGPTLSLQPNTRLYDGVLSDPYWVDQITFLPNKIIEANMYQETSGAGLLGQTVTFDFTTVASSLPPGYEARGFIKVLDGLATWATTQYEWVDLVPGNTEQLSFVVASPGAGTPFVQAGFSLKGVAVTGGSPEALTSVQIIPEPTTFALAGLGAAALVILRRRK